MVILGIFRLLGMAGAIAGFLTVSALNALFPAGVDSRRRRGVLLTRLGARLALRILGVRLRVSGRTPIPPRRGALLVANHLSYVDALLIASLRPAVFVSSLEVRRTPLLGRLAAGGGTYFVHRRGPAALRGEVEALAGLLRRGFDVCVFPEATSSDGRRILPFKPAFFDAAIRASAPVVPACVSYDEPGIAAFHGPMTFAPHFLRLCFSPPLSARLSLAPALDAGDWSRKALCGAAYDWIRAQYFGPGSAGAAADEARDFAAGAVPA